MRKKDLSDKEFYVEFKKKIKVKDGIAIQGFPGIGNIGKLAVDFLIDEIKPKEIARIRSILFPNHVLVNEKNLIEPLYIKILYKKIKNRNIVFISGNAQPTNEYYCHIFAYRLVNFLKSLGVTKIITTGGIGLSEEPQDPKVYCTGNDPSFINEFKKLKINTNLMNFIGPIVGLTGIVPSVAKEYNIKSVILLAEGFNHPFYIGINSSKKIIEILDKKYKLNVNIKKLEKIEILTIPKVNKVNKKISRQENKSPNLSSYIG